MEWSNLLKPLSEAGVSAPPSDWPGGGRNPQLIVSLQKGPRRRRRRHKCNERDGVVELGFKGGFTAEAGFNATVPDLLC